MKNKFGFILIKPQLGENIGACARSMKNFGFQNLNIVSPKFAFPNHKTKVTAVGAYDIINKTKVFNSTEKAVSEFDLVFSLSSRRRDINKNHITINDFFNILKKRKNSKVGLMFGPEASGLSNIDLSLSNYILQIPTAKNFKSLNLSHSVTLICYEIFKFSNKKLFNKSGKKIKISSKLNITLLVKHLIKLLEKKDFFLPIEKKQSMLLNINNLIYRLEPNDKELRILASIISSLSKNKYKP
ncbi:rRNA methyltransferase [Candidatus Pelagibacter bacterium]|nr:rRNA methyltransferase [Candidatus Pelagibacter bacterium]